MNFEPFAQEELNRIVLHDRPLLLEFLAVLRREATSMGTADPLGRPLQDAHDLLALLPSRPKASLVLATGGYPIVAELSLA